MLDYKEVGNRIRYYRHKQGITQEQLAFEIQTSAAYLSNIERATKKPSLQKLLQIAEVLGVTIEDLLSPTLEEQESEELEQIFYENLTGGRFSCQVLEFAPDRGTVLLSGGPPVRCRQVLLDDFM